MNPALAHAVGRMKILAANIILEQSRIGGAMEALRDLAGVSGALAALDAERARFVARHASEAAREGWVG